MRIALISDIHGNDVALQAVLEDIAQAAVDQIYCLGDTATLGPQPGAVLKRLRERQIPGILGNHDAFLLDPELIHTYTDVPVILEAVAWSRRQLSEDDLAFLGSFLPRRTVVLEPPWTALLFHGSPRSHMEDILATTPPDELDRMLSGCDAPVLAGGHTHVQMLRQHRGALLVNPGSVGMPFQAYATGQEPTLLGHAEYATVEATRGGLGVHLRRVPLDKDALREAGEASANPLRATLRQQYA